MTYFIDIVFAGKEFSPNKLSKKAPLDLKILAEYGEIATYGRFKGKAMPYGLATLGITSDSKLKLIETLDKITKKLIDQETILVECGVDEISLEAGDDILETVASPYSLANISTLNKILQIKSSEINSNEIESDLFIIIQQIYTSEMEDIDEIQKKHLFEIFVKKIRQSSIREIKDLPPAKLNLINELFVEYFRKHKNVEGLEKFLYFEGIKEHGFKK